MKNESGQGMKNAHELFLHQLFVNTPRGSGHPGKIPGTSLIPLFETQGRQTFEGWHELFGHHPFAWKTPTPPGGLWTQKVNLCALFSCLKVVRESYQGEKHLGGFKKALLYCRTPEKSVFFPWKDTKEYLNQSEGPKGGRRKGGRGRKLSRIFRSAVPSVVAWSILLVSLWGEEKVMTIYDAGPLAAGPLCGLLTKSEGYQNHRVFRVPFRAPFLPPFSPHFSPLFPLQALFTLSPPLPSSPPPFTPLF